MIKLAGRGRAFDLEKEFGVPADRMPALDRATQLAIGVGIEALRDAGIPLVLRYKTTTRGTQLPDRWALPESLRDDTGSSSPRRFRAATRLPTRARYFADHARREQLAMLEDLRARVTGNGSSALGQEIDGRIQELRAALEKEPYIFDRRFIFRILAMGHSQFAEFIGARGPNTHVNAACASTTQAVSVAEDWIRTGRCRRVIVVSADDVTSDHLIEWLGSAFLATSTAATDKLVEEAALPFDRRRHGMICGMGAADLVVEAPKRLGNAVCSRSAKCSRGDREQRVPWHTARCRAYPRHHGETRQSRGKRQRRPATATRAGDDFHLTRDLYARPRRQRCC